MSPSSDGHAAGSFAASHTGPPFSRRTVLHVPHISLLSGGPVACSPSSNLRSVGRQRASSGSTPRGRMVVQDRVSLMAPGFVGSAMGFDITVLLAAGATESRGRICKWRGYKHGA
jgi:hypothetical protein